MKSDYSSIQSAAKGLLGEAIQIVQPLDLNYIVIGGWSPFLLNSGKISHPGTKDVDLLFSDGIKVGSLEEVVNEFIINGYIVSAKHKFQLLRILRINGIEFVFNIDILHPDDDEIGSDLFVDHVVLPVPIEEFGENRLAVASIVLPDSSFLFDGHFLEYEMEFNLPNGNIRSLRFPLMDELGLIVTKSLSVNNPKRMRDAFDIYTAIAQCRNYDLLLREFQLIKDNNIEVFQTLYGLQRAIKDNQDFDNRIKKYTLNSERQHLKKWPHSLIKDFLKDIGFIKSS